MAAKPDGSARNDKGVERLRRVVIIWRVRPLDMQWTDLTWPAVQQLSKDTPVVFPVAALEQHGTHLPLFTDS